jgi:lipoate-protein ligase A
VDARDLIVEIDPGAPREATDRSRRILDEVAAGARPDTLRIFVPRPTLAFGRLDALSQRFEAARAAAARHGYEPVVRAPGGRAAAYDGGCVVVEETVRQPQALEGMHARFAEGGERYAGLLRDLGVDARVGEVPGEYCPGAFTVNARGRVKLVGTAQRVLTNAWLLAAVITVTGTDRLRGVLTDVYGALGLEMDPATVGTIEDEIAGVSTAQVVAAVRAAYD